MRTTKLLPWLIVLLAAFATYVVMFPPMRVDDTSSSNEICMDYSKQDPSEMEVRLIHKMSNEYKNGQLQSINSKFPTRHNMVDTRAIWFDLETVKAFLYHMEKSSGVEPEELGIRIYYTSYPNIAEWPSYPDLMEMDEDGTPLLKNNYENHHTLIMIPTIRKDSVNMDFDPTNSATFRISLQNNAYDENSKRPMPALFGTPPPDSGDTNAQNHGSLFPPGTEEDLAF